MNEFTQELLGDSVTWDIWRCQKTGDFFVGSKCHSLLYARVSKNMSAEHLSSVIEAYENGVAHGFYVAKQVLKRGEA